MKKLILAMCMVLAACGGGDPEDNPIPEEMKQAPPVNCDFTPELCR